MRRARRGRPFRSRPAMRSWARSVPCLARRRLALRESGRRTLLERREARSLTFLVGPSPIRRRPARRTSRARPAQPRRQTSCTWTARRRSAARRLRMETGHVVVTAESGPEPGTAARSRSAPQGSCARQTTRGWCPDPPHRPERQCGPARRHRCERPPARRPPIRACLGVQERLPRCGRQRSPPAPCTARRRAGGRRAARASTTRGCPPGTAPRRRASGRPPAFPRTAGQTRSNRLLATGTT